MLCIIFNSRIEKNPNLLSLSFSRFLKFVCITISSRIQKLLQRNRCSSRVSHFGPVMNFFTEVFQLMHAFVEVFWKLLWLKHKVIQIEQEARVFCVSVAIFYSLSFRQNNLRSDLSTMVVKMMGRVTVYEADSKSRRNTYYFVTSSTLQFVT